MREGDGEGATRGKAGGVSERGGWTRVLGLGSLREELDRGLSDMEGEGGGGGKAGQGKGQQNRQGKGQGGGRRGGGFVTSWTRLSDMDGGWQGARAGERGKRTNSTVEKERVLGE